jgi:hypothetical protein
MQYILGNNILAKAIFVCSWYPFTVYIRTWVEGSSLGFSGPGWKNRILFGTPTKATFGLEQKALVTT